MDAWGAIERKFDGWEVLIRDLNDDLEELMVPEAHIVILDRQSWATGAQRLQRAEHLSRIWIGERMAS